MQLSTVLACHGYLLLVLSILKLTLASQLLSEEAFDAKVTSLRPTKAVKFDLLEKAFQELDRIDSMPGKFDYETYESIVVSIRRFIKLSSGQLLGEGGAVSGADEEVRKTVVSLADKFSSYSQKARGILFSALMEHLHGADFGTVIFEKYRNSILFAAALNGNYEQLRALVDKSKLGWNGAARIVVSAIAQNGSAELFDKVLQVSSLYAFMQIPFWRNVIKFDKKELFLEFVLRLKHDMDGTDRKTLQEICWTCCYHERQELVRVLMKHKLDSLLRIDLMESLFHVIEIGSMDIFATLLGDPASPGLCKSSLLDYYRLLGTASFHNRVDMVRFMLSLDGIDESFLVNAFSSAVSSGSIEVMELLLGARPDGQSWISTFSRILGTRTINNIGYSGRSDVVEFFLRKRDEGDVRFDGFSVGMKNNEILCSACSWGRHELVKYLLRRNEETNEFIFPDVNPAARNNYPLITATKHLEILKELLRQDEHGGMIYPGVAVTHHVLLSAAAIKDCEPFEFLLQTVQKDDGSVKDKFPGIDLGAYDYDLLDYLVSVDAVDMLEVLLRRDALQSLD